LRLTRIAADRVVLVPGPDDEVAIVREVYRLFVESGRTEREIADELNERGVATDLARPWSRGSVHQLLINEKYIGNNVWARTSCKLKGAHVRNDPVNRFGTESLTVWQLLSSRTNLFLPSPRILQISAYKYPSGSDYIGQLHF
jgi:hypothetical protein